MRPDETTQPLTIRTAKDVVRGIETFALAKHQSRDDDVERALRHYLDANTWQLARIDEGLAAPRDGRVRPAADTINDIAAQHNFKS